MTYTHPRTYCWIVCEQIAARGWQIHASPHSSDLSLPGRLTGIGVTRYAALVDLCRKFVARYKLPIKLEIDPKYHEPAKKEHPYGSMAFNVDDILAREGKGNFAGSILDDMLRRAAKDSPLYGFTSAFNAHTHPNT